MPYRGYDKRVKNYDLAVVPDVVRIKFENRKSAMVSGQQEAQAVIVDIETKVRELLDDYGVLGVFRVPYLNFARTLIRAKGHNSGIALQKIATAEKAKFVTIGLDPEILDKIIQIVIGGAAY